MPQDIERILETANELDLRIIREGFGEEPEYALRNELYSGRRIFTGFLNGDPICLFGGYRKSALDSDYYIWMLGTPKLRANPVFFMRFCSPILEQLVQGQENIFAIVDPTNEVAFHWMEKLGFSRVDTVKLPVGHMVPLLKLTERKWLS